MKSSNKNINGSTSIRIRHIRESKMMSQREFGKEVGVVQNYICQLENGRKLTKKIAKRIIDRFGIYEEWLFTGKGEMDIKDEANIIDRLKRENAQLQRENDILNKALMLLEKQGK